MVLKPEPIPSNAKTRYQRLRPGATTCRVTEVSMGYVPALSLTTPRSVAAEQELSDATGLSQPGEEESQSYQPPAQLPMAQAPPWHT